MREVSPQITKKSQTNFAAAFWGLSRSQRKALHALYAFCRTVDDIADESKDPRLAKAELQRWRGIVERLKNPSAFEPTIARELSGAVQEFPIQLEDLHWILDGVESDLDRKRYQTFEELLSYCDGVASAVGLASMAIFGSDREQTQSYVFATGRALQLTNILRDVGVDAQKGRIYLPLVDLEEFGYKESELLRSHYNSKFIRLMKFQVNRVYTFYKASENALSRKVRQQYPAAECMRKIYYALLRRIEAKEFNVFHQRVGVSPARKIAIATSVWGRHFLKIG